MPAYSELSLLEHRSTAVTHVSHWQPQLNSCVCSHFDSY